MSDVFLGVDLGTSSVKVVMVDETGRLRATGTGDYPVSHPQPGWAEQDPEAWWRGTVEAVRQAVGWGGSGQRVAGIGFSGQMHGTVLRDQAGRLLAPAIIWADGRSRTQVEEITAKVGPRRLIEIAGSPARFAPIV